MFVSIPNYYAQFTGRSRHASAVNQTNLNSNIAKYQSQKIQHALDKIDSNASKNSSSMFESETKSFTFCDDLSTLTSDELSSKLSVSHDTFCSSSVTEQKILENHVNFSHKSALINYDPISATSSLKTNNVSTTGSKNSHQRIRSNAKSHLQFFKYNINSINNSEHSISTSQKFQEADSSLLDSNDSPAMVSSSSSSSSLNKLNLSEHSRNETTKTTTIANNQYIIVDGSFKFKKKQPFYNSDIFIGFIWSWNFMLGKRWRGVNTGDEFFQDCELADFRAFVSNKENRLVKFYNDSKN